MLHITIIMPELLHINLYSYNIHISSAYIAGHIVLLCSTFSEWKKILISYCPNGLID